MRRLARWTLNALTALSSLLCLATAGLWVRSYFLADGWCYVGPNQRAAIFVLVGEPDTLDVAWDRYPWSSLARMWPDVTHQTDRTPSLGSDISGGMVLAGIRFGLAGFGFGRDRSLSWVRLPLSLTTLLLAVLPACRWRRRRAARRALRGLCASCSYDLTGNITGVCPECGTAVTKAMA